MQSSRQQDPIACPIEVRVYEYGLVKASEWCTTEAEAFEIVDRWQRQRGVHCDIVGLPR